MSDGSAFGRTNALIRAAEVRQPARALAVDERVDSIFVAIDLRLGDDEEDPSCELSVTGIDHRAANRSRDEFVGVQCSTESAGAMRT
jgi:hypothetical protein